MLEKSALIFNQSAFLYSNKKNFVKNFIIIKKYSIYYDKIVLVYGNSK